MCSSAFLTWRWIANRAPRFGAEVARSRQIRAGMRPVDHEPFLPPRQGAPVLTSNHRGES
jgi:hypothetical protein